jgi:hypothetical protein
VDTGPAFAAEDFAAGDMAAGDIPSRSNNPGTGGHTHIHGCVLRSEPRLIEHTALARLMTAHLLELAHSKIEAEPQDLALLIRNCVNGKLSARLCNLHNGICGRRFLSNLDV